MRERVKLLPVFLLVLVFCASVVQGEEEDVLEIYLFSPEVASEINVATYLASGNVVMPDGSDFVTEDCQRGPAPAPYPEIHVWEPGMERLGKYLTVIDGLKFHKRWEPGKKSVIKWKIEIHDSDMRFPTEFTENLTVSLWVDWNLDEAWGKNELLVREHLNIADAFPTNKKWIRIYYVTSFIVPDIDDFVLSQAMKKGKEPTFHLWVRGVVSYDDPDVSPDGEQLFGDYEDYLVRYKDKRQKNKKDQG